MRVYLWSGWASGHVCVCIYLWSGWASGHVSSELRPRPFLMPEMVPHTLVGGCPFLWGRLRLERKRTARVGVGGPLHQPQGGRAVSRSAPPHPAPLPAPVLRSSLGSGGTEATKGHAQASGSPASSRTTTHFMEFILMTPDPGPIWKGLPQQLGWHLFSFFLSFFLWPHPGI